MLTKKQLLVAQAVYEGRLNEPELCREFKVTAATLVRWLGEEDFQAELGRLCAESVHQTRRILSRYGPTAALQLATLLGSEKDDTVRRAALDLVDRCLALEKGQSQSEPADEPQISDEQAKAMLMELVKGWS